MDYKNDIHKRIFEDQIAKNPCRCGNEYLAALYLLTADKTLWNASKHVIENKIIDFTLIDIKGISTYGYTLCKIAQDIYLGTAHITLKAICCKYVVSDLMFKLIITALSIGRPGYDYIGIDKKFN